MYDKTRYIDVYTVSREINKKEEKEITKSVHRLSYNAIYALQVNKLTLN